MSFAIFLLLGGICAAGMIFSIYYKTRTARYPELCYVAAGVWALGWFEFIKYFGAQITSTFG